jgi:DNA-binding CsgD family transcriptional regulator/tetratricopeptide (TPR) repeat protein
VPSLSAPIIGRELELLAIERFVDGLSTGPAALVLEGVAGIGKTALWNEGVSLARTRGVEVRTCRCGEADAAWAFAGLSDLLDGLPSQALDALPEIQQRALSAALLLSDAGVHAPGSRAVGVALLGVLRELARCGPLLLAVDDVQWLDPSSARVLSFALRRLGEEPVRLLTSYRLGLQAEAADRSDLGLPAERIVVGPVSIGTLQRIVQLRLTRTLSRPTVTRLHHATGGNPLVCLEMARALHRRGREPQAGEPLTVPADVRLLVSERLHGLGPEGRLLLLATAALAQPTVSKVAGAMASAGEAERGLADVLAAGVVELDGERLRVTHPLLASVPYEDLTAQARRRLHARLADAIADPEEHARHAALASAGPDGTVAAALDAAARSARRRGSIDAAAELAELAVSRTPADSDDDLLRRTVDVAEYLFLLGNPARARTILTERLDRAEPGPHRVRGLLLLASIESWAQGDARVAALCDQAMREAGDDPELLGRCHATFAETSPSGAAQDLLHAETAVALLEASPGAPPGVLSNALSNVAMHGLRLGRGLAVAVLERAVDMQADGEPPPVSDRAGLCLGMTLKVVDRFDESRSWLHAMRVSAVDEGDDSALPVVFGHLALLECWAGDFPLALRYAVEGREHAARTGANIPALASAHVLVLAHLGRLAEARTLAERDLADAEPLGYVSAAALYLRSLAFTELAAGNAAVAADHGLRALAIADEIGIGEPAIMRLHPDAVAALVSAGRLAEAEEVTRQLDSSAEATHLPWSTAMAARCHGLLLAARGDAVSAVATLERALTHHERLPMPFELARTRLLLGTVQLRAGHRNAARHQLELAQETFAVLGAPVHARFARVALAGIGGRRAGGSELTPVEARVAALVSQGHTNREVAGALFMSVRTVESHLGRIFRKLGLRSRTALAHQLAPVPPRGSGG